MSQRQRRKHEKRQRHAEPRAPLSGRLAAASGIALGATLTMGASANAATFTVSNTNDSGAGSLRDAIASANGSPGSTITFSSGLSGTITLTSGQLGVTQPVTIQGPGPTQLAVSGNTASRVFYVNASQPVTISGLTIKNGTAPKGGGIFNKAGGLAVSNSIISGNTATNLAKNYAGGGIYDYTGPLTITNSTLSGNVAVPTNNDYGGGLFVKNATTSIQGSTIVNNSSRDGGGVYFNCDLTNAVTIQNSTITQNHAVNDDGGGVWFCGASNAATLTIVGSTVTGNTAATKTGGIEAFPATSSSPKPILDNSIVSGNTSGTDPTTNDVYTKEPPFQAAFDLIQNPGPSGQVNTTVASSNIFGQDPQLGPLQNNGGPTQTEAPLAGSPVINKGAAFGLTTDQRGAQRPVLFPGIANSAAAGADGSDIGAVELDPGPSIAKVTYNKKKGTATVSLNVFAPGTVRAGDANDKTLVRSVSTAKKKSKLKLRQISQGVAAGLDQIVIRPTATGKKKLKRKGKLRATAKFIYTAPGLLPTTLAQPLILKLKRH